MNPFLTDRVFSDESNISKIIKWWLAVILILIPFQSKIQGFIGPFSSDLSVFIGYLDLGTIIVLFPLALIKIFMKKEYPVRLYGALLFLLALLFLSGLVSGLLNGNPLHVTVPGTFEYVESFLVIFIFAAFYQNYDEAYDIFNVLIKIALFIVAIALIQECWALISRYILGIENYDIKNWRMGIYRPTALMTSSNVFGLYVLLIFILYLSLVKKVNYLIFIVFLVAIILSLSRVVYTGLIFLCIAQVYRGKKAFIVMLVPILLLLFTMVVFENYDSRKINTVAVEDVSTYSEYRKYTRRIAISIWKDHVLFGAGPGMYGGVVSLENESNIYQEYSFSDDIKRYLQGAGNIDQFWFQALAELGIAGVIILCLFFISLLLVLLIVRIWASSDNIGNLFVGLLIITMTIIIFTTYTGLRHAPLMFTYSAIIGMAIGSEKEKYG